MQLVAPSEKNHYQYKYIVACITILLVYFKYYALLSTSVYIMAKILLQIMVYCIIIKSDEIQENHMIKRKLFIIGLLFSLISVYYELYDFLFRYSKSAIFIVVSVDIIIGFVVLYFISFLKNNKLEFNNMHISIFINIILISTIVCAVATDHWGGAGISYPLIWLVFCILHIIWCCKFNNKLNKLWILGNFLVALYFTIIRLYMISYFTRFVRSTGWALAYATSIFIELLIIHFCIALIALIICKMLVKTKYVN